MDVHMIAVLIAGGGALGVMVWVLAEVGEALVKVAEALAAAAVVFLAVWLMTKAVLWALRQVVIHWRTSLTMVADPYFSPERLPPGASGTHTTATAAQARTPPDDRR